MSGVDERVLATAYELGASQGLTMTGMLPKPLMLEDLKNKLAAELNEDHELSVPDLRRAIAEKELVPYYQPKASLIEHGWTIDGVEALVR